MDLVESCIYILYKTCAIRLLIEMLEYLRGGPFVFQFQGECFSYKLIFPDQDFLITKKLFEKMHNS